MESCALALCSTLWLLVLEQNGEGLLRQQPDVKLRQSNWACKSSFSSCQTLCFSAPVPHPTPVSLLAHASGVWESGLPAEVPGAAVRVSALTLPVFRAAECSRLVNTRVNLCHSLLSDLHVRFQSVFLLFFCLPLV